MVSPAAKAVEETANNGHNGLGVHWLFMDFSQEVELWEGNFPFVIVEPVCMFEVGVFVFGNYFFVFA